ncbi:hypothetical protein M404DRAFT_1002559 [Pisolithus tinctorius Marx 270]|uniref:Uncharacterized protein n=1 Tax=Pisolithus tinctorius Marx 270 TaxID=870435 RepID=A0A0C3P3T7_PISTI|nr:hypothetical protein M404DRAFT_1002559 [Pisolithus tinctorius Marx 270]
MHPIAYGACHRSRPPGILGGRHCEIHGCPASGLACWCLAGDNKPKGHSSHQRRNAREPKQCWYMAYHRHDMSSRER